MIDVKKKLLNDAIRIERAIIAIMVREAEQFVTDARDSVNINSAAFPKGDYTDRTTNLRNSIGYFILKGDQIIKETFPGGLKSKAKDTLRQIPSRQGYRLIGIAGEHYGVYLESKGYNVITSQSFMVIDNLDKQLKKLAKKREIDADLNINISSTLK